MSKIYLQVEADINKIWNSFTDKQQKNIVDDYINPDSMVEYLDGLGL